MANSIDYAALAKQAGGTPLPSAGAPKIDYGALAKQAGGTAVLDGEDERQVPVAPPANALAPEKPDSEADDSTDESGYAYHPLNLEEALAAKAAGKPTGGYVDRYGRPAPSLPLPSQGKAVAPRTALGGTLGDSLGGFPPATPQAAQGTMLPQPMGPPEANQGPQILQQEPPRPPGPPILTNYRQQPGTQIYRGPNGETVNRTPVDESAASTVARSLPGYGAAHELRQIIFAAADGGPLKSDSGVESVINGLLRLTSGLNTPESIAMWATGAKLATALPALANSPKFVAALSKYPNLAKGLDIAARGAVPVAFGAQQVVTGAPALYKGIESGNLEEIAQGAGGLLLGGLALHHGIKGGIEAGENYPVNEVPASGPARKVRLLSAIEEARVQGDAGNQVAADSWAKQAQQISDEDWGKVIGTEPTRLNLNGKPVRIEYAGTETPKLAGTPQGLQPLPEGVKYGDVRPTAANPKAPPIYRVVDEATGAVLSAGRGGAISEFLQQRGAQAGTPSAEATGTTLDEQYSQIVAERAEAQSTLDQRKAMQSWPPEKLQARKSQLEELLNAAQATGRESIDPTPLFAAQNELNLINRALAGEAIPSDKYAEAVVKDADARLSDLQKQRAKFGKEGTQLPKDQRAPSDAPIDYSKLAKEAGGTPVPSTPGESFSAPGESFNAPGSSSSTLVRPPAPRVTSGPGGSFTATGLPPSQAPVFSTPSPAGTPGPPMAGARPGSLKPNPESRFSPTMAGQAGFQPRGPITPGIPGITQEELEVSGSNDTDTHNESPLKGSNLPAPLSSDVPSAAGATVAVPGAAPALTADGAREPTAVQSPATPGERIAEFAQRAAQWSQGRKTATEADLKQLEALAQEMNEYRASTNLQAPANYQKIEALYQQVYAALNGARTERLRIQKAIDSGEAVPQPALDRYPDLKPATVASEPQAASETPPAVPAPAPDGGGADAASTPNAPAPKFPSAKLNPPARAKALAVYRRWFYTPGNVVSGYGGEFDKVLQYDEKPGGTWNVQVVHSDKEGNPLPNEQPRWHATPPDKDYRVVAQAAVADKVAQMAAQMAAKANRPIAPDKVLSSDSLGQTFGIDIAGEPPAGESQVTVEPELDEDILAAAGKLLDAKLGKAESPAPAPKPNGQPAPNKPRQQTPQEITKQNAPAEVDPATVAAQAARDRMRARRNKPAPLMSRAIDAPAPSIAKQDLVDLSAIGAEHMIVHQATAYKDWTARMMADVGDLLTDIAEETRQTPAEVLRTIHGYASTLAGRRGVKVEAPVSTPRTIEKAGEESILGTDAASKPGGTGESRGSGTERSGPEDTGALAGEPSQDIRGAGTEGPAVSDDLAAGGADGATDPTVSSGRPGGQQAGVDGVRPGPRRKGTVDTPGTGLSGDYTLTPEQAAEIENGGARTKARANLEAIRTLKLIQKENRPPTLDEQAKIARYVGWGASELSQGVFQRKPDWAGIHDELKSLLTPEEFEAARISTINAHFTRLDMAATMWDAARSLGFRAGGSVAELGMGIGNFFITMPGDLLPKTGRTGVEMDLMTGAMAKALYPGSNILNMPLQHTNLPDGYYDLIIGNFPFANIPVNDPAFRRFPYLTSSVHNYFFAKGIEKLRPGGVMLVLTSRGTLDAPSSADFRKWMSERAELLGAIRLPNDTFVKNAGTSVTTDMLVLRRRIPNDPAASISTETWVKSSPIEMSKGGMVDVNEYFQRHPEMMMGEMNPGTQYHKGYPELFGKFTLDKLNDLLHKMPEDVIPSWDAQARADGDLVQNYPDAAHIKNGNYVMKDGALVKREGAYMRPVPYKKTQLERAEGLIGLRGAAREVIRTQRLQMDDGAVLGARKELNKLYDAFVTKHGPVNSMGNVHVFADDPDWALLSSLEDWNKSGLKHAAKGAASRGKWSVTKLGQVVLTDKGKVYPVAKKRPIQYERTIVVSPPVEHVDSGSDGLAVSLNELGRIDWDRMQRVTGRMPEELQRELTGQIYQNPTTRQWETADEYLSGNVRKKLRDAEFAAKENPALEGNVEALRGVQPRDLLPGEIDAPLGANWVPDEVYQSFMTDVLKVEPSGDSRMVEFIPQTGAYAIRAGSTFTDGGAAIEEFLTPYFSGLELTELLFNGKTPVARDPSIDPFTGNERSVKNKDGTIEAVEKQRAIADRFGEWLWADPKRATALALKYNEERNNLKLREFNGSHLTLPGLNRSWLHNGDLDRHQKDAVWRIIQSGNTLLAHVVGAGKTLEMIVAAMEMKRLGLAHKPMVAVPNHLVGQWRDDWLRAYPGAELLVPTKKDFEKANRQKLMARIATGNYDAVIVGHNSFGLLPVKDETYNAFIEKELEEINNAISASSSGKSEKEAGRDPTTKNLVRRKLTLEAKLEKRAKRDKKDDGVSFEELGVDHLFVDEADLFKNLGYMSQMDRVAGLPGSDADRSVDMLLKTRYISDLHGGTRGIVFATGTPVSNSIAEIWTMMRYLMPKYLAEENMDQFDSWAKTFGRTKTQMEVAPEGGRFISRTRFAEFNNAPELMNMFRLVADVKMRKDLNLATPAIETGGPQDIISPGSKHLLAFVKNVGVRADAVRNGDVEPDEDNMLKICSDARKASLDMRLINPSLREDPESKANRAVKNIASIYREFDHLKGTQLVFLDLSTPKSEKVKKTKKAANADVADAQAVAANLLEDGDAVTYDLGDGKWLKGKVSRRDDDGVHVWISRTGGEAGADIPIAFGRIRKNGIMASAQTEAPSPAAESEEAASDQLYGVQEDQEEESETAAETKERFTVYNQIKQHLIEQGVPADEIAFVHDANTAVRKTDLFDKMNRGEVRVMLGSTEKMGAGMNVQTLLVALHHLDTPWRPRDIEQRNGRIERQGNQLWEQHKIPVRIFRYQTEGSFDAFMWETVASKAKPIEQFMAGDPAVRRIEEMSTVVMSYEQAKAVSSGSPLVREKIILDQDVNRLEIMRGSWLTEQSTIHQQIGSLPAETANQQVLIDSLTADIATRDKGAPELVVNGTSYEAEHIRKTGADALLAALRALGPVAKPTPIKATYRGFPIEAIADSRSQSVFRLSIKYAGARGAEDTYLHLAFIREASADDKQLYSEVRLPPQGSYGAVSRESLQPKELSPERAAALHELWEAQHSGVGQTAEKLSTARLGELASTLSGTKSFGTNVNAGGGSLPLLTIPNARFTGRSGSYLIAVNYGSGPGTIASADSKLRGFEESREYSQAQHDRLEKKLIELETRRGRPFKDEEKLKIMLRRQQELNDQLGANADDMQAVGAGDDESDDPLRPLLADPTASLMPAWFPEKRYFTIGPDGRKYSATGNVISKYLAVREQKGYGRYNPSSYSIDHIPTGKAQLAGKFDNGPDAVAFARHAAKELDWNWAVMPDGFTAKLAKLRENFVPPTETPAESVDRHRPREIATPMAEYRPKTKDLVEPDNGFMHAKVGDRRLWSDGRIILTGKAPGAETEREASGLARYLEPVDPVPVTPVAYHKPEGRGTKGVIWFDNKAAIESRYYDYIVNNVPNAKFQSGNVGGVKNPLLFIYSKGKVVGAIQPSLPTNPPAAVLDLIGGTDAPGALQSRDFDPATIPETGEGATDTSDQSPAPRTLSPDNEGLFARKMPSITAAKLHRVTEVSPGGKGIFVHNGKVIDLGTDLHAQKAEKFLPGTLFGDAVKQMLMTGAIRVRGEEVELYERALDGKNLQLAVDHAVSEAKRKHADGIGVEVHAPDGGSAYTRVPLAEVGDFLGQPAQFVRRYGQLAQGAMFSRAIPGFYSQLERVIEQKMKGPASPAQLLSMLRNPQSGIKQDELVWSGLDTFLESHNGAVTPQQVKEFLKANNVQVEEVVKGGKRDDYTLDWTRGGPRGKGTTHTAETPEFRYVIREGADGKYEATSEYLGNRGDVTGGIPEAEGTFEMLGMGHESNDLEELGPFASIADAKLQIQEAHDEQMLELHGAAPGDTKFANYVLPGGDHYKELLLKLPSRSRGATDAEIAKLDSILAKEGYGALAEDQISTLKHGGNDAMNMLDDLSQRLSGLSAIVATDTANHMGGDVPQDEYRSPHWDEPNVLAHIRFNDRTGPKGEKILNVEEIQSDWGQQGKKQGYRKPVPAGSKLITDGSGKVLAATDGDAQEAKRLSDEWEKRTGDPGVGWVDRESRDGAHAINKTEQGVPPMPFSKTWHELAFRRALRYAAENGYDALTWTDGAAQAARYDLSKQIDSVLARKQSDGTFSLAYTPKGTGNYTVIPGLFTANELADHVGKDLADKIVSAGEHTSKGHPIEFSGLDLKVGGEGMKGFYDQILPAYANKLAKKWGAKVGTTEIDTGDPNPIADSVDGLSIQDLEASMPFLQLDRDTSYGEIRAAIREAMNDGLRIEDIVPEHKATTTTVHSLPINAAMRDSVMQGQPLFARNPNPISDRSTSPDSLAQPAAPRTGKSFTLDPSTIERLPDAPSPAGKTATLAEITAFWEGTAARVTDFNGRPALLVNIPGMEVVLRRMGLSGKDQSSKDVLGITLTPKEWNQIIKAAKQASSNPRSGGFDDALIQLSNQIQKAMGTPPPASAGLTGDGLAERPLRALNGKASEAANPFSALKPLIVVQASNRIPDNVLKRVGEEESDHALQMELPEGLQGLPLETVESPAGQIAAQSLTRIGYPKLNPESPFYDHNRALIAAEIGARLMRPGRYKELDLTAQEARQLTEAHIQGLAKHGDKADSIIELLYAALKENPAFEGRTGSLEDHHQAPGARRTEESRGPPARTGPDVPGHRANGGQTGTRDLPRTPGGGSARPGPGRDTGNQPLQSRKVEERPGFLEDESGDSNLIHGLGLDAFMERDVLPALTGATSNTKLLLKGLAQAINPRWGVSTRMLDMVYKLKGDREKAEFLLKAAVEHMSKAVGAKADPAIVKQVAAERQDLIDLGLTPLQAFQVDVMDRIKTGQPQANRELQNIADFLRQSDDDLYDQQVVYKDNLNHLENHQRVMWKVIPGHSEKRGFNGPGRRPLQGTKGQFKQHVFENMSEGVALGGVPYTYNPVEMFVRHYVDVMKFLTTQRWWEQLGKMRGRVFVKGPFPKAPEGFEQLNDAIAKSFRKVDQGVIANGEWFVEKGMARLMNNYLSRDLLREQGTGLGAVGQTLLGAKNIYTSVELGFSGFHFTFVTFEAGGSSIGLGLTKIVNRGILQGDVKAVGSGLADMAKGLAIAPAARENWKLGHSAVEYLAHPDEFAKTPEGQALLKAYPHARELMEDLFAGGGKLDTYNDYKLNSIRSFQEEKDAGNYAGAGIRAILAAPETFMKPLFEWYIPRVKVGVFLREYSSELLERNKEITAGTLTRPELARQVWDFVEDRFGEMNYDNLFWNRTFKTAMQILMRSPLWKLGSLRAGYKGVAGQSKELFRSMILPETRTTTTPGGRGKPPVTTTARDPRRPPRLVREFSWLFGMAALTVAASAVIQYAFTRKHLESVKDAFFPRTDPDDPDQRITPPTYAKEYIGAVHDPAAYAAGGISGILSRSLEVGRNKDYFNNKIWEDDDSAAQEGLKILLHFFPVPIGVKSFQRVKAEGGSVAQSLPGVLGMPKAPRYISQTPTERLMSEYARGQERIQGRPANERADIRRQLYQLLSTNKEDQALQLAQDSVAAGKITDEDWNQVQEQKDTTRLSTNFKRLPVSVQIQALSLATPEEKQELLPLFEKKWEGVDKLPEIQQEKLMKQLEAAHIYQ